MEVFVISECYFRRIEHSCLGIHSARMTERTDPSQNRSMKFSVGLPQPAYAFVSEVSVPANSPWSQLRQAKNTSLAHISFFAISAMHVLCQLYCATRDIHDIHHIRLNLATCPRYMKESREILTSGESWYDLLCICVCLWWLSPFVTDAKDKSFKVRTLMYEILTTKKSMRQLVFTSKILDPCISW